MLTDSRPRQPLSKGKPDEYLHRIREKIDMTTLSGRLGHIAAGTAAALLLAACGATRLPQPITGYTCCNLRDNGGWIFSDNVQDGKLIPAGEPITLTSTKRTYYVYGEFAQRSIGLWDTQSDNSGQVFAWVHRIVVSEDPRPKIAALPPEIRDAIHAAKVVRGMTRQQVLWAVGYPGLDETPDLAGPVWRYWTPKAKKTVDIQFGPDGKVVAISGPPASVQLMSVAP